MGKSKTPQAFLAMNYLKKRINNTLSYSWIVKEKYFNLFNLYFVYLFIYFQIPALKSVAFIFGSGP